MIRIARTYTAKPGKERDLVEVLKEIRGYASTQGVQTRIFSEPWGRSGLIRLHNDFDDAGQAQVWWQNLSSNPRAQTALARIQMLIEGHRETSFLVKMT